MEPRRARWFSLATLEMFLVTRGGTPAAALSSISIVTGANKGIGLAIAKKLADSPEHLCILTARDPGRGEAAVETLRKEGLEAVFKQLDIGDPASVERFASEVETEYGRCDVLVNNAGIAFKVSDPTPFQMQAEPTLKTNFFGTVAFTERMLPLLRKRKKGRVVNVASGVGSLSILNTQRWRKAFTAPDLTKEQLSSMVSTFVEDVKAGRHESEGWPSTCYGMSKLGLIAYTTVLARLERESRYAVLANSCSPGYVATDMTSHKGTLTPEEGAWTPFVLTQTGVTGRLFRSGALSEW